jgi:tRNA(Ile)-lysidine synthase TilS/MesJ
MTQRQLAWRTDSSNSEAKYKRNRVRLQLVPLLEVREEIKKKLKKKRKRARLQLVPLLEVREEWEKKIKKKTQ